MKLTDIKYVKDRDRYIDLNCTFGQSEENRGFIVQLQAINEIFKLAQKFESEGNHNMALSLFDSYARERQLLTENIDSLVESRDYWNALSEYTNGFIHDYKGEC